MQDCQQQQQQQRSSSCTRKANNIQDESSSLQGDDAANGSSTNSNVPFPHPRRLYDWRLYSPKRSYTSHSSSSPPTTSSWFSWWCHFLRWFCEGHIVGGGGGGGSDVVGGGDDDLDREQHYEYYTKEQLNENFAGLARCIILLRQYLNEYGMPEAGGPKDQEYVLREVCRDLYAGGTPLWALESIMQKAAEGVTGDKHTNWLILPRKAFWFSPGTTTTNHHQQHKSSELGGMTCMFSIDRGFNISKLERMERVAVRLASFASNTPHGVGNLPQTFPSAKEFMKISHNESVRTQSQQQQPLLSFDQDDLARMILSLASTTQGLFFFVNSRQYEEMETALDPFWIISGEERELFSRLATMEGMRLIDEVDSRSKPLYSRQVIIAFRVLASAGACGFWFNGSWQDMIVAGLLAVVIAFIAESSILSKQEKIIYEIVASFVVGISSGLIALTWPNHTCFGAMAIAGVLDILQGFRVVYAVIETMSKHTLAGGADLLEGILFTGLISYFLRFGQYAAAGILKHEDEVTFEACTNGINQYWYIIFVPLAAMSWSGLFNPRYHDLISMTFHGCLAYAVNFALAQAGINGDLNNFIAASCVSVSAGIFSRFTGRQAVGNTVAGLYVLLPGAYMVKSLYGNDNVSNGFFSDIILKAVIIGVGAWTGSILCSPTLLGTTRGMSLQQSSSHHSTRRSNDRSPATMLYF